MAEIYEIDEFRSAAKQAAVPNSESSSTDTAFRDLQTADALRHGLFRKDGHLHIIFDNRESTMTRLLMGARKLAREYDEPITIHAPVGIPQGSTVFYHFTRTVRSNTEDHVLFGMSDDFHEEKKYIAYDFGKSPLGRRYAMLQESGGTAALQRFMLRHAL